MPSRWEHLFDQKPVPLLEHLMEEVSKLLAKDLGRWPLPVEELDIETGGKFAQLVLPEAKRPDPAVFEEAFKVARWELERDLDASADYFRNARWRERALTDEVRVEILFISRWLYEQLLSLREFTHSRVTRANLVDLLERIRRRCHHPSSDS